ncbi:hypothetical protein V7148_17165 [Gottfriedia acidiceleris]|uniref:hypothetical protein n=1 Tax=Bacillaceae TaxID=186817 RepID=UPI0015965325|nr:MULTISPECIES: hypothetical protein [unclassified Bacillus (in: firmicutes)]
MDNFSLLNTLLQLIILIVVVYIVIIFIKKVRLFAANNLFISNKKIEELEKRISNLEKK